jgi:uncharacterized protein YggE
MYRFIIHSLFIALISTTLTAQNNETDPYIEVTGSSEMSVIPDIIIYTVELQEYEKDRKIVPMDKIEAKFLEAVNQSGIEPENINVSDISSYAFKAKRKRKAYANKTYNLTFSNPQKLVGFIDRLENLDIKKQFISRLDHSEMTRFRLDIKKGAMAAARDKARALLSVVDTELGKPLIIREINSFNNFSPRNTSSNAVYRSKAEVSKLIDDIEFKPIKIRFEIFARFAIQ